MAELRRIALTSTPLISEKIPSIQTAKREFPPGNKDVSFTTVFFYVEEPSEELCPQYDFTKLLDVSKAPDVSSIIAVVALLLLCGQYMHCLSRVRRGQEVRTHLMNAQKRKSSLN